MGYIYLRKNLSNGKCYVGQTKDIKDRNRRWNKLNERYAGYVINNARKKYGTDGFSFEILKECPNEDMNYWETYYIKQYNSKKPNGYNSTDGGDSVCEMTDETKKKISAAQRGKPKPKVAAAQRGKPKPKVSAALKGRKRPDISAAQRGKPKPKVSAALKGKKLPEETKEKISAALRGKPKSSEHKAKVAAAKSKPVQALDKNGNVVMEFPSTQEAQRQYGFHASNICKCCNGKLKTAYGYIWKFKEKENAQE